MDLEPATQPTPEKEKSKEADDARKFITEPLSLKFLAEQGATPFLLITDWTETNKGNETKVVYKKFNNGKEQTFLISKTTDKKGKRTKEKIDITENAERYKELKGLSKRRVEKMRHEFAYTQNGITFTVNYDEFAGGQLFMLDVDAKTEEERDSFDPDNFPVKLFEVGEDPQYSGHRITEVL